MSYRTRTPAQTSSLAESTKNNSQFSRSVAQSVTENLQSEDISFTIDGGGVAITTGLKGYRRISFSGTILEASMIADQSGSIVVDIWKCTYAQFDAGSTHPVVGDKIAASAPPTIATATKADDSTLTGWTTAISAGDILAFNVNSVTTVTRVTVTLKVQKT